jgi:hypothetical protein
MFLVSFLPEGWTILIINLMETNNLKDIDNTNHDKGKGNGFLGFLMLFLGFITFLVLVSKLLLWLMN